MYDVMIVGAGVVGEAECGRKSNDGTIVKRIRFSV